MPEQGNTRQIVMNEDQVLENGVLYLEQIIFEMDYENLSWKRLKRRKLIRHG